MNPLLNGMRVSNRDVSGSCACSVCFNSRKGEASVASKTRIADPRICAPLNRCRFDQSVRVERETQGSWVGCKGFSRNFRSMGVHMVEEARQLRFR